MALDNANYIAALSPADPLATDPVGEGDDHIRTVKTVLVNTFVGDIGASDTYDSINGAVLIGPTVLNALPGRVTVVEGLVNDLSSPPAIGDVAPNTGAFTTLDVTSMTAVTITTSGLVNGRDMPVDGVKLDGIEDNATSSNNLEMESEVFAALYAYDTLG